MIDANSTVLVTPIDSGGPINGFANHRKGIIESSADSSGNRPNGLKIIGNTVKDATTWTFDIQDEQNVTIQNVKMLDDFNWVHSDGYDIVSTNTALIDNCLGVTGDDTFDAKAGDTNPITNIIYSNDVAYSGADGTKVGVQSMGGASNIIFSNIQVIAGQRAVSIAHDEGTASWSDIHFNDIHMENLVGSSTSGEFLVAPIVIWSLSGGDGPISNVSLSRVTIDDSRGFISQIKGTNSTGEISNVTLQDVSINGTTMNSSNYTDSFITVGSNVTGLNFGLVAGGIYTFVSQHNSLAMDSGNSTVSGSPVIQWPVNSPETTTQQWELTSVSGNTYRLVNQQNGYSLSTANSNTSGAGLIQSSGTQTDKEWTITSVGNGYYKVISAQSGDALDDDNIASGTKSTNTQVVQFTPNGNTTQKWQLTKQ